MGIRNGFIGLLVVIVIGVISIWLVNIHYNNSDKGLRNRGVAQKGVIEIVHDEMWKVLRDEGGVAEEYKSAFSEIYVQLIEGRYSQGDGSLMKWITEHNPEFDTSLYQNLMRSIEKYRHMFAQEQKVMIDIIQQHNNLLDYEPSSWFVKNKERIEYTVISSSTTKEVMETGVDDNFLFNKK